MRSTANGSGDEDAYAQREEKVISAERSDISRVNDPHDYAFCQEKRIDDDSDVVLRVRSNVHQLP